MIKYPVKYKDTYSSAINQDQNRDSKLISVKDITAHILLIVGEDDQMWDSDKMAKIINSQNPNAIIASYKNAGHIFVGDGIMNILNMRIKVGETIEGNGGLPVCA